MGDAWGEEVRDLMSQQETANPNIGPRLKQLVKEADLTPLELQRRYGYTRQHFYKIWHNEVNVTVQFVCRLLNDLGRRWGDLDYPANSVGRPRSDVTTSAGETSR